jgi:methylated-DNA-[protein]-cysteine S-methyltransferase
VRSAEGLVSVRFARGLDVERELRRQTEGRRVVVVEDPLSLRMVTDSVLAYLNGSRRRFDQRLDLSELGDFGRDVLDVVSHIPYGTLRSYKWVAEKIGRPRATRPVGQALARNPVPIVVPCHRVVNSDGTIGGYSGGGPDMKRRLIEIETGQTGLPLDQGDPTGRKRIRFILDAE